LRSGLGKVVGQGRRRSRLLQQFRFDTWTLQ
jgi:hypothetical protein